MVFTVIIRNWILIPKSAKYTISEEEEKMVESEQSKSRQLAELRAALQRNMREAEVLQWNIDQLVAEGAEVHQHVEQEPGCVVECDYSKDCDPDLQSRSSEDICLPGSPITCSLENSFRQPPDQVVREVHGSDMEKLETPLYVPIKPADLVLKGIGGEVSVKKVVAGAVSQILNFLTLSSQLGYARSTGNYKSHSGVNERKWQVEPDWRDWEEQADAKFLWQTLLQTLKDKETFPTAVPA